MVKEPVKKLEYEDITNKLCYFKKKNSKRSKPSSNYKHFLIYTVANVTLFDQPEVPNAFVALTR